MPFNLLLLPLLGGYILLHRTHYFRYRAVGLSNYRLIFQSAVAGVLLTCASYLLTYGVLSWGLAPSAVTAWKRLAPFPYAGSAFGAFMLGATLPTFINRFWMSKRKSADRVIGKYGDALQQLLYKCQRDETAVMLTLKTGKLYVGQVTLSDSLAPTHVSILPTLSGYRDPAQRVRYTGTYHRIYRGIRSEDPEFQGIDFPDFEIVIPYDEILSATPFRIPVARRHFTLTGDRDFAEMEEDDRLHRPRYR